MQIKDHQPLKCTHITQINKAKLHCVLHEKTSVKNVSAKNKAFKGWGRSPGSETLLPMDFHLSSLASEKDARKAV